MRLNIEFVKQAERKEDESSVSIEVHQQRGGDTWNVIDAKEIAEGEKLTLNVPNDSRVLLVGPGLREDMIVYDREQMAAVKAKDATPGKFFEQGSSTGDGPNVGVESNPTVQSAAEETRRKQEEEDRKNAAAANKNINTQKPNTVGTPVTPPVTPGAGVAKPGDPAKPTGVSNQQTLGSPPPSNAPGSQGTTSADQLKDQDKK